MLPVRLSSGAVMRVHRLAGPGVPLVFLHGLGCASSCDYPAVAASPALAGRAALLVDLLGFGFSDKPEDFGYTTSDHAHTVAELLQQLQLPQVHLFGHSMGGAVAIEVTALVPGRVATLVLSEPNLDPGGGTFSGAIAQHGEADYVRLGHPRMVNAAEAAGSLEWAGTMGVASALAVHRGARSLVRGTQPTWRALLQGLAMPRTVLFGEASLPDGNHEALPRAGVVVDVVPRAGHSMAWENPAGVAEALARAVAR
jgi:pimeloyl-ACP methyl ester carboxylesterase